MENPVTPSPATGSRISLPDNTDKEDTTPDAGADANDVWGEIPLPEGLENPIPGLPKVKQEDSGEIVADQVLKPEEDPGGDVPVDGVVDDDDDGITPIVVDDASSAPADPQPAEEDDDDDDDEWPEVVD